jgi:beta-galactosidase GanA
MQLRVSALLAAVAAAACGGDAASASGSSRLAAAAPTFEIVNDTFLRDGEPFYVKAGCIHYSRVPVEYWEDRLLRLRAMGLNAVQTYVPWNWHEEVQGTFDFGADGVRPDRNLTHFLSLAQGLGMVVVLRAGPCVHSPFSSCNILFLSTAR